MLVLKKVSYFYTGLKYCGCKFGTDALLLSLIALGIKKGDKVIVPSFTFFATVEVVMHLGAIPIFVDINTETYTIDIEDFKKVNKTIKSGDTSPSFLAITLISKLLKNMQ